MFVHLVLIDIKCLQNALLFFSNQHSQIRTDTNVFIKTDLQY